MKNEYFYHKLAFALTIIFVIFAIWLGENL